MPRVRSTSEKLLDNSSYNIKIEFMSQRSDTEEPVRRVGQSNKVKPRELKAI